MRKLFIILLLFLNFNSSILAYDLNGTLSHNDDGTYSVSVQNNNGHEYDGGATDNVDGTLDVSVQDYNGQSYSGTAMDNSDGTYDLDLQNDSSGGNASGTLSMDD